MDLDQAQARVLEFARERDWTRHHTPKNVVMALTGEVGELSEIFQWLTDEQAEQVMNDPLLAEAARDEVIDVLNYLLVLADRLQIDLAAALEAKLAKNAAKYPVGGDHAAMRGILTRDRKVGGESSPD